VVDGGFVETPMPALPGFLKQAEPVWYGTHRHLADGDDIYAFSYLFRYVLDVPPNATSLTLPNDPRIKILAITLTDDPGGLTVPASVIFDDFDPLRRPLAGWEPTPAQPEPVPDTAEETEVTMPDQEDENLPDVMRDTSGDDSTAEVADAPGDTTTTEIPGIGKHSSGCQSNTGGHPASLVLSVLAIALLLMTRRLRSCRRTA
jgi:hypothetical protein